MTYDELFEKVNGEEFEGLGLKEEGSKVMLLIRHKPTALITQIPAVSVSKLDWPTLESVLTGKRDPTVLQHMSRIVGYFSRIENWNRSKIAELKDRHKGDYAIANS